MSRIRKCVGRCAECRSGSWSAAVLIGALLGIAQLWLIGVPVALAAPQDEYNLALRFYEDERWEQAARQFRKFLDEAPQHEKAPLAQLLLGQSFVKQRQFTEARDIFRQFIQSHPEHRDIPWAMYRTGECSYFLDDFPAARDELRAYVKKAPGDELNESALQFLGESELRLKNPQAAASVFEEALKQFGNGSLADESRFGLARAYEALERKDDALQQYRELAAKPQSRRAAEAQFNIGARLFEDGNHSEAAQAFDTLVEAFPQHRLAPLARLNAGFSRYYMHEYPAAIARFEEVRQADPKLTGTAAFWTGLSYKAQGQFAEASRVLLDELQRDPSQKDADRLLFHAADCQLRAEQYREALRLFVDVARRWPQSDLADDSLNSAMEAAVRAGDLDQAEAIERQFQEQYPQSGLKLTQQLLWGRVLLEQGDQVLPAADVADETAREQARQKYRDAAQQFEQVLSQSQLDATRDAARLQLARAWERLDNHQRTLETLQPLLEQTPATQLTPQALVLAANAWNADKKYDKAAQAAEQVLRTEQSGDLALQALGHLARARAHLGELDAAQQVLDQLQKLDTQRSLAARVPYEVGEIAYDAQQWDTAEQLFRKIVEQGSSGPYYAPAVSGLAYSLHEAARVDDAAAQQAEVDGQANVARQKLLAATGRFNESAQWFARLRTLIPTDQKLLANALYMQALSLKLARRQADAAKVFEEGWREFATPEGAADLTPAQLAQSAEAYRCARGAARAYAEAGDLAAADTGYAAAFRELKLQPADQQQELDLLINEWALVNYKAGQFERSDELFRKLIQERPDSDWSDDARLLLAESDFFADRLEPARQAFRELAADERADDFVRQRSLVLLLDIGAKRDDWSDVTQIAGDLIARYPDSDHRAYADYRLGESLLRSGKFDEARPLFESLIARRNEPSLAGTEWLPSVWLMLAEVDLGQKNYDGVRTTVAQFRDEFPDAPFQYKLDEVVGRSYMKEARFEEARQAFQQVIDSPQGEKTETAAKAQFHIAESFITEKRYDEAFDAYYRVLNYGFPEWHAPALLQAGRCDERLKRWTGAAKTYEKLINEFPETSFAEQAKPLLRNLQARLSPTSTP